MVQEDQIYATEVEQTGYRKSQLTEPGKAEFHTPAIPNMVRDCVQENSLENDAADPVQMTLPTPDTYPQASAAAFDSKSEDREEITDTSAAALEMAEEQGTYTPGSQKSTRTLESQPVHLVTFTCKDTSTSGSVDYQSKKLNFELYVLYSRAELAIFNSNHNRH